MNHGVGQLLQLEVVTRNLVKNHNLTLLIQQVTRQLALDWIQAQSIFYRDTLEALLFYLHIARRTCACTKLHTSTDRYVVIFQKISAAVLFAHVRITSLFDISGLTAINTSIATEDLVGIIRASLCARAIRIRILIARCSADSRIIKQRLWTRVDALVVVYRILGALLRSGAFIDALLPSQIRVEHPARTRIDAVHSIKKATFVVALVHVVLQIIVFPLFTSVCALGVLSKFVVKY